MQHYHEDIMGRTIAVGDYIVFPKPGYGSGNGMAPLGLGEVVGLTKGGVKVKCLDQNWQYEQVEKWHYEETSSPMLDINGNHRRDYSGNLMYMKKRVNDGWFEREPILVKATTGRYFITEKP